MRNGAAFSHLAGREVSTWSEEWRHECEVAAVLAMSPADRKSFFNGKTDAEGGRSTATVSEIMSRISPASSRTRMTVAPERPFGSARLS